MGIHTFDDAGVYRINEGLALVQTLDFFPPLVEDPFTFGQIAAANALSDVYAMNGRPLTVMNIVGFPDDRLPLSILGKILQGAADRIQEAGATTVGGHSVRDAEIKFGLSVTGLVDPREVMTNASARVGDSLVLTKPLGTGFVTTAQKRRACPTPVFQKAVESMIQLNAVGRDAIRSAGGVHSVTDITGFGLAGHASEMAEASGVTIRLDLDALPLIEGVLPLAIPRYFTRASRTNRAFLEERLRIESHADPKRQELTFDAQTSGGLLIAVDPAHVEPLASELRAKGAASASIVGDVVDRQGTTAIILR